MQKELFASTLSAKRSLGLTGELAGYGYNQIPSKYHDYRQLEATECIDQNFNEI